jgi:hypothetical protein
MNDLGACPLWKISDVSKTDGVADGNRYRVDFTAILTLKDSPSKAWADAGQPGSVASMPVCNMYWIALLQKGGSFVIPEPRLGGLSLSEQYKVTGYAVMVKSENGWRLAKEISGLSFDPIPGNFSQPSAETGAQPQAATTEEASNTADPSSQAASCVDAKMRDWDKQHAEDIERAAKDAKARGEEIHVSAGMEDAMRNEALTRYVAECQGQH